MDDRTFYRKMVVLAENGQYEILLYNPIKLIGIF